MHPYSKNKTAFAISPYFAKHLTGAFHPERPERYLAIINKLEKEGLLTKDNAFIPRKAARAELLLCHTPEYIQLVAEEVENCKKLNLYDGSYTLSTGDVQICPDSWDAALLSVGGVLDSIDKVMTGQFQNAFTLGRPPGHHACSNRGMGFCLFNQIAIGARYAQKKYGLKKILIADWDVHHGNGTQEIFESDPTVFYFSTHQWPLYPGTGAADEKGKGAGVGTIMNFPIASSDGSRELVIDAFQGSLTEAMQTFQPELVLISAGFDGHEQDPLGGFNLTEEDFATLTEIMKQIANMYANNRIVSVLEGGYNLQALAASVCAHAKELMKDRSN